MRRLRTVNRRAKRAERQRAQSDRPRKSIEAAGRPSAKQAARKATEEASFSAVYVQ